MFHADGQTDTMKLTDVFRNFAKGHKKLKKNYSMSLGTFNPHNLDCDILGSDAACFGSNLPTFLWKELPVYI